MDEELVRIADDTNREFARVVGVVKAAEMLDLVSTPKQMVELTSAGKGLVQAPPEQRRALWREQLLTLGLFREVYEVLQQRPDRTVDTDFVLETIVTRMPYENYAKIFNTFVHWSRFGELFAYDEATQQLRLL